MIVRSATGGAAGLMVTQLLVSPARTGWEHTTNSTAETHKNKIRIFKPPNNYVLWHTLTHQSFILSASKSNLSSK